MSEVELVKRLRRDAELTTQDAQRQNSEHSGGGLVPYTVYKVENTLTWQAADTITRLLKERDEARARADSFGLHAEQSVARCHAAESQVAALTKAISTINGYMTNACISLAAGGTKAHATRILNESVDIARAALQAKEAGE